MLLPSSPPRWNAPPRAPALSGRQLELAWNVLVARCAAAAASSPSPRSDRRRRQQTTGGTEERRSLDFYSSHRYTATLATWCNPPRSPARSPYTEEASGPCLALPRIRETHIRSSTPHRQQAGESCTRFQRISYQREGRRRRVPVRLSNVVHAFGGYGNDSGSIICAGDSSRELERSGR